MVARRILLALLLLVASLSSAPAQIQQSGTITPGHVPVWIAPGILGDGGPATAGNLSNVGITANDGLPFCINTGPTSGAYDELCLSVGLGGVGQLSLQNFNGAVAIPFQLLINGTPYSFTSGGGLVTSVTAGTGITVTGTPSAPIVSVNGSVVEGLTAGTGISVTGTAVVPIVNLAAIANHDLLANISGGALAPSATTLSAFLDDVIGSTPGDTIFRGASGWTSVGPGADASCYTYHTAGPSITWGSCAGSGGTGTVTQIIAGTGLTGGTITTTGTITVSYGTTGGTAAQGNDSRITGALQAASNLSDLANVTTAKGASGLNLATVATSGSASDLGSGTLPAARLPNPAASTLGGINSKDCSGSGQVVQTIGTDGSVTCGSSGGASVLRSYIAGCILSNDSGTPTTKLDISACQATDSTNAVYISPSAFTKSISGAWTSGSGNNGMGNGLTASAATWYHVFAIINAGSADIYFDTSAAAANAPASTTAFRRIGSIMTDGSVHILAFFQDEETFYWGTQLLDVNTSALGVTASLYVLTVPPGVKVRPLIRAAENGARQIILTSPDETDVAPGVYGNVPEFDLDTSNVSATPVLYTDTLGRVRARANSASSNFSIVTRGWIDSRGRFN
jgi:hypothetical protein